MASILWSVVQEINRAESKHGYLPKSIERGALVLGEEYGELIMEVVDFTRKAGRDREPVEHDSKKYDLIKEAIQTAACCVRLIENIQIDEYER